jgi:hypothetical protein
LTILFLHSVRHVLLLLEQVFFVDFLLIHRWKFEASNLWPLFIYGKIAFVLFWTTSFDRSNG